MYLSDVALNDFRSYQEAVVHLEPGVCLFVGANGQGKTNFVEAIGYLSNFHSHRANQDTALVRYAAQGRALQSAGDRLSEWGSGVEANPKAAVIRVKAVAQEREILVDLEVIAGKANRARLARNSVPPKEVRGLIKSVLFAPEDLQIVRSDPAVRRRFLDDLLIQLEPVQAGTLSTHQKILKQRAALLKSAQKKQRRGENLELELSTLEIWNQQLCRVAAQLVVGRIRAVELIRPHAQAAYRRILGADHLAHSASELGLNYQLSFLSAIESGGETRQDAANWADVGALEKALYQAYRQVQAQEIARGVNLVGPHRDDLLVTLDALPVKGFASHGETWTAVLALRLGQFELLDEIGETPILLLDDVFAELDASRRAALVETMRRADQVLVTSAVVEDLPKELEAEVFRVVRHPEGSQVEKLGRISGGRELSGEGVGLANPDSQAEIIGCSSAAGSVRTDGAAGGKLVETSASCARQESWGVADEEA